MNESPSLWLLCSWSESSAKMHKDNSCLFAECSTGKGEVGMRLSEEHKPAGKRLNYDAKNILFTLTMLCCSAWGENWKEIPSLGKDSARGGKLPLFCSWHMNGLLKWCLKSVFAVLFWRRQSPSEFSHYRGFIQDFVFLAVVWTSLVVLPHVACEVLQK